MIRLGLIQINVTDVELAWSFYVDALGLPARRLKGPNSAFEIFPGEDLPILVYPVDTLAASGYPHSTGTVLVFFTSNLAACLQEWKARDVQFIPISWSKEESGIAESPYGLFIAFQDPFGNVHELLEPTSRKLQS